MRKAFRSFVKSERGASAVEFSIVAAPFFFLLMWIIQLGVYFMTQVALDNGVIAETLTMHENLVAGTLPTAAAVKQGVVTGAGALVSNSSTTSVEVRTISDLSSSAVAITDGATDYGTVTSTLVIRASAQVIAIAPSFGTLTTVTSSAMLRRQGK